MCSCGYTSIAGKTAFSSFLFKPLVFSWVLLTFLRNPDSGSMFEREPCFFSAKFVLKIAKRESFEGFWFGTRKCFILKEDSNRYKRSIIQNNPGQPTL